MRKVPTKIIEELSKSMNVYGLVSIHGLQLISIHIIMTRHLLMSRSNLLLFVSPRVNTDKTRLSHKGRLDN